MNLWQQNYDPAGNIWLSSLIASLPILFFFFALIKLKLKGYVAASWTVAIALAVALLFYKMPVANALASVVYGFFYGLWPNSCGGRCLVKKRAILIRELPLGC